MPFTHSDPVDSDSFWTFFFWFCFWTSLNPAVAGWTRWCPLKWTERQTGMRGGRSSSLCLPRWRPSWTRDRWRWWVWGGSTLGHKPNLLLDYRHSSCWITLSLTFWHRRQSNPVVVTDRQLYKQSITTLKFCLFSCWGLFVDKMSVCSSGIILTLFFPPNHLKGEEEEVGAKALLAI